MRVGWLKERFGVSGSWWFLCDLKKSNGVFEMGLDGVGIVVGRLFW